MLCRYGHRRQDSARMVYPPNEPAMPNLLAMGALTHISIFQLGRTLPFRPPFRLVTHDTYLYEGDHPLPRGNCLRVCDDTRTLAGVASFVAGRHRRHRSFVGAGRAGGGDV